MSVLLNDASSEYLVDSPAVLTAVPMTMVCMAKVDSISTHHQSLISLADTTGDVDYFGLVVLTNNHATYPNEVIAITKDNSNQGYGTSGGVIVDQTWFHAAAVFASTTSRIPYLNGVVGTENTTSVTPASIDITGIGALARNSITWFTSGDIAEVAFWNVALTTPEIAALAKGFSPLLIRPQNLVAYWPLIREGFPGIYRDYIGGRFTAEPGSSAVSPHPRVIYPGGFYASHVAGVAHSIAGTIAGTSGVSTASLSRERNIVGTIQSSSSLLAVLRRLRGLTGLVSSVSSGTASLFVLPAFAGTITGIVSAWGSLLGGTGIYKLQGVITASSNCYTYRLLEGTENDYKLTGLVDATTSVNITGNNLIREQLLESKVIGPVWGRGEIGYPLTWCHGDAESTGQLARVRYLKGIVTIGSSCVSTLSTNYLVTSYSAVVSAVQISSLSSSYQLQGSVTSTASLAVTETKYILPSGTFAATSGITPVTLQRAIPLSAVIQATTGLSAPLCASWAMVSVAITGYGRLVSTWDQWCQGNSSVVAALQVDTLLRGSTTQLNQPNTSTRGRMIQAHWFTAGMITTSAFTSQLRGNLPITGISQGTSTSGGILTRVRSIEGTIAGTSGIVVAETRERCLEGSTGATSSVTGELLKTSVLSGAITTTSSVVSSLATVYALHALAPDTLYGRIIEEGDWVEGTVSTLAALASEYLLAGTVSTVSTVESLLSQEHLLRGNPTPTSSILAALAQDSLLIGNISGTSNGTSADIIWIPRAMFLGFTLQRIEINSLFKQDVYVDILYEQVLEIAPIFESSQLQINEDSYERVLVY